jgi:hypothetical protein
MMVVANDESSQLLKDASDASDERSSLTIDRRRGLRIHQNRPIKVYEATSARYIGGQTQDISSTGLRIELPISAPVRAGKLLNIHVGLSSTGQALANRRHMIPARVVWVNRNPRLKATLIAGIEFLASIAAHLDAA